MSEASMIRGVEFAVRDATRPLLVLGPSLGTSVTALWEDVVPMLTGTVDVVGWDLPGHGESPEWAQGRAQGLSIADLAGQVAAVAFAAQRARGAADHPYWYAGVSVGGAVGLQLLLDSPVALAGAALLCSAAHFPTAEFWSERADLVEKAGTPTQVAAASQVWFGPGFLERHGDVATRLLASLQVADRHGYAAVCRALADFDVRDRLSEITAPVLAVAGACDSAAPLASLTALAAGVPDGRLAVLPGVAHQAPAEAPAHVAELILEFVHGRSSDPGTRAGRAARAMTTRREVLGREHVAGAVGRTSAFTADFQDLITRYAWGEVWGRPGLDRRMRSAVTLTALVAGGHWDELAMHVRAALRNGLTQDELGEILLQTAIYCSVPSAHHAFAIADEVLREAADTETDGL